MLETNLLTYMKENFEHFRLVSSLSVLISLKTIKIKEIIDNYMVGVEEFNSFIQVFRFFDQRESAISKVDKKEGEFLQKNAVIKNGVFQPKDTGVFKLTDLEVMTNPIQFEKVMDNYYFNLEPNSKKFLEHSCLVWKNASPASNLETQLIREIIKNYPISVPILASVRLEVESINVRFA